IEDQHAAGRDGADAQLLVGRRAQLARDDHIQLRPQRAGDLVPHHDAAARERHDDGVFTTVADKRAGQLPPGVGPIVEWCYELLGFHAFPPLHGLFYPPRAPLYRTGGWETLDEECETTIGLTHLKATLAW